MKLNLSFFTGTASLAMLISGAFADSAVTDPVGYVTLNIPGGTPTAPKVSYLGATLVNPTIYAGAPTSSTGPNNATFAANSFTTTFGLNSLAQSMYYVEIAASSVPADVGLWTNITASTTNSLTLADAIGAKMATATQVKIRLHHTMASVFGDASVGNPLKLIGGPDNSSADLVELISPAGSNELFFNSEEGAWFSGSTPSNEQVIAVGDGLRVRRTGAATSFVQVGHVKTGPTTVLVEPGTNLITGLLAVPTTGTTATPLPFDFTNSGLLLSGLTGGADNSVADIITRISSTGVATDIFYNSEEGGYFSGSDPAGNIQITEGTSIRIFHRGPAFNWTVPAVLIAP